MSDLFDENAKSFDRDVAERWEAALQRSPKHLAWLHEHRGISHQTAAIWGLGWDRREQRYTIPVEERHGRLVNVRKYKPNARGAKVVSPPGFGSPPRLLGLRYLDQNPEVPVLVCAGEFDMLLAWQHDFEAVTGTGGEGTVPQDLDALAGRDVFLVYDCDEAGRNGAAKLAEALAKAGAASVRIVDLGYAPDSGNDLTDFLHLDGRSADDLRQKLDAAPRPRAQSASLFRRLSAHELAADPGQFRWLAKGLWPAGSQGVLAGEKKTLKTYVVLSIAVAVAAGVPVLGQWEVKESGPVHLYVGEGGRQPFQRRLQRICATYGLVLEDLPLTASFDVAALPSDRFRGSVERDLEEVRPVLTVLDPLYAFHGSATNASNLYERGELLAGLAAPIIEAGSALIVVDHFNKTGSGTGLDRLAQSGMAEWADSWILQRHRRDPDLATGEFRLSAEISSRQWGGSTWDLDFTVGEFDPDLAEHIGDPAWTVRPAEAVAAGPSAGVRKREDVALRILEDQPFELTHSQLVREMRGRADQSRQALDSLLSQQIVVERELPRQENGRTAKRRLLGLAVAEETVLRPKSVPEAGRG